MNNFIEFINVFLSYFLVYIVSIAFVVTAVLLGIRYRKYKDAKGKVEAQE